MAIGVAECKGEQQRNGQLLVRLTQAFGLNVITHQPRRSLPSGIVFLIWCKTQKAAKIFKALALPRRIDVKALHNQHLAVFGDQGVRHRYPGASRSLHAQMLVQGHKGLMLRTGFDDMPLRGHRSLAKQRLRLWRQELRNHARHSRGHVLGHQFQKNLLRCLAMQQGLQVGQCLHGIGLLSSADLNPAD